MQPSGGRAIELVDRVAALERELEESKQIEAGLRESEATLRAFLESASQGVVVVGSSGEMLVVNAKTEELFGYTRQELLGKPLEMLLPERLQEGHVRHRGKYFAHPHVRPMGLGMDLAGRRKDGREFPVEVSLSYVDAGGRGLALGFITDITERKRNEGQVRASLEALQKSEATVRALLESASQSVVAVDPAGRIMLVNAKTEQMFGYQRDELLGREIELLLPERFRPAHVHHRAGYVQQPRERPMGLGLDLAARRKDGTEFPVEISLSYVKSEEGVLAISFVTDITERKRFEEQLRQTQKLESLGVLAGGVAHDFNNLLTGIMSGASFALEMLAVDHPLHEVLATITRASERAAGLTRQLLAYSGKGRFIVEPADLSELISEIVSLIQSSIPKTVSLRLELAKGLPRVEVDLTQMQQLVMNLIINGAEAMGGRNGTVTVRTDVRHLDEASARLASATGEVQPGTYVSLEVQDTGCGMDEATQLRIFDPFFTTKFTGRGLGLAAALGIVRGHRGSIQVESAPGDGSTFRVLLPAAEQATERTTAAERSRAAAKGTILIADDEEIIRSVAKDTLQYHGYTVLLARNGKEAVDLFSCARDRISLVLLDMSMPGISGDETLRSLQGIRPDVPVLVSSGYSEVEVMRRFSGTGLAGFLQKPYKAGKLLQAVESILSLKK